MKKRRQAAALQKMSETISLPGAQGCIGSWIVKALAERGDTPVVFDRSEDNRRLAAIMETADLERPSVHHRRYHRLSRLCARRWKIQARGESFTSRVTGSDLQSRSGSRRVRECDWNFEFV
jgi:NAD(P)-dependent dehydrogenase (short-subunit alcohol dehydrogenase family)